MKHAARPLALVVLLENVGHIHGIRLPPWIMAAIDFVTEEYAKALLHLYGAYGRYDLVRILEDEWATGPYLADTLLQVSKTHRVDLLLLVHGYEGGLVGYRGRRYGTDAIFGPLQAACRTTPGALDLRMVYGLNCYGASLIPTWLDLGVQVVNGAVGVNWMPEPSLSTFLRAWLNGVPYSRAVEQSYQVAVRWWRRIWRPRHGQEHPFIASSRQVIAGRQDVRIHEV
ncbi:hypothetical protein FKZ61_019820 [Litorilinea aerophila]|uniref:Uncharacterized protein n=1 Tax=Litorilinea aerophila TaxID=1204385 RepID=A0A540VAF8_9CHLR|nr:hypothetical protein [Litorilinea aerophila]MCC9078351.1 hypothetical protein [Litorilinea aerophila]OUC05076.1 hypothetical protein RY27_29475 [Litorilinea aerophila]GIV78541.1 MAG: hypothetical protein KatS3mg050_2935 [Litorilinea sp.]